jgi:predicted metal-dependent hydrolase
MDTQLLIQDWPPPFTLKKSPRARYVKLKASVNHGLEVVVPLRFNQKYIPEIFEENRVWISKQLAKIESELLVLSQQVLPTEITFPIINRTWNIFYIKSSNKLQLLKRPQQELVLLGNIDNKSAARKLLLNWVKEQARLHLPSLLQALSDEVKLPFKSVTIRNQKSRWGSCTSNKAINLNFKLLFLPNYLVKHIMIHELCHTKQLNHSAKFWRLVANYDPQWEALSKETRAADKFIPGWAVNIF